MKDAETVLREITLHVRPPRGCAIVLLEWEPKVPNDQNCIASYRNMWTRRVSFVSTKKLPRCGRRTRSLIGLRFRSVWVRTAVPLFGFPRSRAIKRGCHDLRSSSGSFAMLMAIRARRISVVPLHECAFCN